MLLFYGTMELYDFDGINQRHILFFVAEISKRKG
jgi:hypothetical protein